MKYDNSNCYGFAIGVNSPLIPGTNNGIDSPINLWSSFGKENQVPIKIAAHQLKSALLKDGLNEIGEGSQQEYI